MEKFFVELTLGYRMNLLHFQKASLEDMPTVHELYKAANYGGTFSSTDETFIAKKEQQIIGVVRLANENNIFVLRGMQIKSDSRGQGIGKQLLEYFMSCLGDKPCYCIPYRHLINFYSSVGFTVINNEAAPAFLVDRFNDYVSRKNGKEYALMFKPFNN